MFYEAELRLLRETFRKCRIQTSIVDPSSLPQEHQESKLHNPFVDFTGQSHLLQNLIPQIHPETLYRLTDPFECRHLYFLLPESLKTTILTIGPFLYNVPNKQKIMEWAEGKHVSPTQQRQLEDYYANIPLLQENSHLFVLVDAFLERLWGHSNYTTEDIDLNSLGVLSPLAEKKASTDGRETLWNMEVMEQRYAFENELMDAVSKGQIHKADSLLAGVSTFSFEQRATDPLSNAKNYCIIMNTLLRKSAEKGGVHPLYLDNISSLYAAKIEQLRSVDDVSKLMTEMFRAYCRLVRKHAMKGYSPPIQKALICIDANLADNLSLSSLADNLNISSSYLSTLFKKETGQTVTEYITARRMKQAMHLLETTKLQVQTIAQHCGILDVQYFSKLFKKSTGMSPKQYRSRS